MKNVLVTGGLATFLTISLTGCTMAEELMGGPSKTDPIDGFHGYQQEGGTPVEVDFGDGQQNLLALYQAKKNELQEISRTLQQRNEKIQELETRLETEIGATQTANDAKNQSEAANQVLRKKIRELESRFLTQSVRHAELEMELTQLRIAQFKRALEAATPKPGNEIKPISAARGRL